MPEDRSKVADLSTLEAELRAGRNFEEPPLQHWHPPLSGEIDIQIRADGSWWHEGVRIERESIVRLFAAILRREDDGHYYLVTPGEKWRLQVEAHPLLITAFDRQGDHLLATLNTGKQVEIDQEHSLFLDPEREGVAGIRLNHGLTALCSRPAWYQLVDLAVEEGEDLRVSSGSQSWSLTKG